MRKVSPELLLTISDIFTNLSAGWFGAALIIPTFSEESLVFNLPILIIDVVSGTVCFIVAYILRKKGRRK